MAPTTGSPWGSPLRRTTQLVHSVAFRSPLARPYRYSAFNSVAVEARGFFEIFSRIRLDHLAAVFLDGVAGFFRRAHRRAGPCRAGLLAAIPRPGYGHRHGDRLPCSWGFS